jgi:hypothetical protein
LKKNSESIPACEEFSIIPYAFVLFIDSISDKIIQLHEKFMRYVRERKASKGIIECERIMNSNSLLVLF